MVLLSSALDQLLEAPVAPTLLYPDSGLAMLALNGLSFALLMMILGEIHDGLHRQGDGAAPRLEAVADADLDQRG